jgi:DNA-binding CsgD family transcriptional regulator
MSPVNFGFQDLSGTFPNGWSFSGSVSQAAGMGSLVAATLASGSSLHQDFAPTTANGPRAFTLSFSLRLDGVGAIATNTARKVVASFNKAATITLSPQGRDVLVRLAQGHTYVRIANDMGIAIHTVRNDIRCIYEKLQVHSRTEAVAKFKGL